MKNEIAISVKNISKTFRIPHNKVSSVRGAFVQKISSSFKKSNDSSSPFEKGGQGGFSAGFEEFKALDDVSFEVKKGEFFGIIGRNGSGKSTLLKILAGIYQADKGSVEINGMISPFLELGIGFNPELSGRDNVYLNATVLGMTKKQIDEKFDSIVAFSELERFIDQKLKNYSSGMQVRLAFSVSIHANRDILLMDEVLAVGDNNFQQKCINEFKKYRDSNKTVVLVTHDITTAQKYCDRLMLIKNGKIIKIGNPQEVGNEYSSQNIEDQYEKEEEKNKKDANKEVGSKKAEILNYEFINHLEKTSFSLESGKRFKVKLEIKFNESLSNPVVGIMFKDISNSINFGIHTLFSRNPIQFNEVKKGNVIEIIFDDEMILVPGVYIVSIICSNQKSEYEYELLDIVKNPPNVEVRGNRFFWGMINSNTSVNVRRI